MLLPRDAPSFQPPAGITPNFVNPDSLRPATIGVGVVVEVLAFVFVVLRLLANSSDGRKLWWNDVACIVAFIFSVGCTAIIIRVSPMARHQYDIPESWYDASYFKSVYVLTVFLNLGMFAAKNTMLLLYLRIFNVNKTLRRAIIGGIIFTIPVYWISVVLESYYCAPHVGSGRWDLVLAVYCSHASLYSIIQGVLNVLLDLYIIFLPISPILHLNLSYRKKLGVLSIFATALITKAMRDQRDHYLQLHASPGVAIPITLAMWKTSPAEELGSGLELQFALNHIFLLTLIWDRIRICAVMTTLNSLSLGTTLKRMVETNKELREVV
ncbi:hypothetical protein MMC14_007906 [Varicellaria rhodocarpa]|nr:hypothetical protein [Varicellaria rhodocarpa]